MKDTQPRNGNKECVPRGFAKSPDLHVGSFPLLSQDSSARSRLPEHWDGLAESTSPISKGTDLVNLTEIVWKILAPILVKMLLLFVLYLRMT